MIEQTQPGIFHIHIDARYMSPDLSKIVKEELGFYDHHFIGHPDGYEHFEPNAHLTRKIQTGKEFKQVWGELERLVEGIDFIGYLEGEYIPSDDPIPESPYDDSVEFPFRVERRRLRGTPEEQFRETEIHLVMDKDKSDERVIRKILDAGLYGAFLPKKDHTAVVLTMQGFKRDIEPLSQSLTKYLHRVGGVVRGTIKEERAINYKLIGVNPVELPEIADKVIYHQ